MQDITVEELKEKIDSRMEMLIIDVREEYEYDDFNIGAKLIPLGVLPKVLDDMSDYQEREIVVHCNTGARSAAAKVFMERHGFKNVRSLLGGVSAWQNKYE